MPLQFQITDKRAYLRCDLLSRESPEDTEKFLAAVRDAAVQHSASRILIRVYSPRAFFRVEKYGLSRYLEELAAQPAARVALVAKHFEVRLLQQYVEVLARMKHANLRSFADDTHAIRWLGGETTDQIAELPGEESGNRSTGS